LDTGSGIRDKHPGSATLPKIAVEVFFPPPHIFYCLLLFEVTFKLFSKIKSQKDVTKK
jgi:hypothetical protein